MISRIKKWWLSAIWNDVVRIYHIFPSTTRDPHEKAWREEHFLEMRTIEWKLFKLRSIFVIFYFWDKKKRKTRPINQLFYRMHHPASATRQLADWYRLGPQNPPPAVRRAISHMNRMTVAR